MINNSNLKVLIVDDTPENLLVISKTLESGGYEMRFSQNGVSALAIAKEINFDLIILDVMMPNMDGFEVCRRLKADPNTANIPVIFITAKTDTKSILEGFKVGGVDYVAKPFHIEELRARVGTHLKLSLREKELQQLNFTKDKFISIISHELQIPLSGIKGFVNVMQNEFELCSITDIRANISLLKDAIENLSELINNLLNWSNLQIRPAIYKPNILELNPTIGDVIYLYKDEAAHKQINVQFNFDNEYWVYADIEMLESVLCNLLSNAIKFGRRNGWVKITTSVQEQEVIVTIEDNGIGMNEENCKKLFRLDTEVKQIGTHGEVGTGMGLILAKEYVERHGGRIWLESEVEKGTRVFFTLPIAKQIDN